MSTPAIPTTPALDGAAAARLADLLARTCFAERVETARRGGFATYEPWPPPEVRGAGSGGLGEHLWRLAHLGEVERERFEQPLWEDLCAAGLAEDPDRPGRFELTAHRGLVAARDRPCAGARGGVHIGEDSLRFAEAILAVSARGRALDVGSGSGISSCALGRTCEQVHAIDVVPACVEATGLSMGLNGMGEKVRSTLAQLDVYEPPAAFDCVVGNLPGVPVPPGLTYPPDGAGGPDGLQLMRLFLDRCHTSLAASTGVVVMRFQSLGDERGPLLLGELRELAPRVGWDVSVMTESRIPASVRAALTAHHALPVNPGIAPLAMLARADEHLERMGMHEYYASTLVARPGGGAVTYTNLSGASLVGRALALEPGGDRVQIAAAAVPAYYGRAHDLPDSFWELGSQAFINDPPARLEQVVECLATPMTVAELLEEVFADHIAEDPIRARFLYVTVELLCLCLLEVGAARIEP